LVSRQAIVRDDRVLRSWLAIFGTRPVRTDLPRQITGRWTPGNQPGQEAQPTW